MDQHYFIFREPESVEDLKQLFRLRNRIYQGSRLHSLAIENELGFSIDCYDLNSHHFGLYEYLGEQSQPVGYVRIVTDS